MKVLLLGGTGSIGGAILPVLRSRGHEVVALARSTESAARVAEAGAAPLRGDIRSPEGWSAKLPDFDAVVHAAATFESDMADVDQHLVEALVTRLRPDARLLYTGGCWLYGATGDRIASEEDPLDPPADFAWMAAAIDRLRTAPQVESIVIHPAMVYARDGGAFARLAAEAHQGGPLRVVESEAVRWPLVQRDDLAQLYALALERGRPGEAYNGAAVEGLPVGRIARAIARRYGLETPPEVIPVAEITAELGSWARGLAIDQQMSGAKARRALGWEPVHTDPLS